MPYSAAVASIQTWLPGRTVAREHVPWFREAHQASGFSPGDLNEGKRVTIGE